MASLQRVVQRSVTSGQLLSLVRTTGAKPVCEKCLFRHKLMSNSPNHRTLSVSAIKYRYTENGVIEIGDSQQGSIVFTPELVKTMRNMYKHDTSVAEEDEVSVGMLFSTRVFSGPTTLNLTGPCALLQCDVASPAKLRMNEELTFENRVINKEGNIVHLGLTVTESRTNKPLEVVDRVSETRLQVAEITVCIITSKVMIGLEGLHQDKQHNIEDDLSPVKLHAGLNH